MDKARQQTDKKLNAMEAKIGRIYKTDPALKHIEREYARYMGKVREKTEASYKAYINESDQNIKQTLKQAYMDEIKSLTLDSEEYNKIVKKFIQVMAMVNQKALQVSNKAMTEIYCLNYNQVAVECKKVGIKVNG